MSLFNNFGIIASTANNIELPIGAIIMWDGTEEEIPKGWYKCDGDNGTPDLTGRFILGTTNEVQIGDIGGNSQLTLTENTIPYHVHDVGVTADAGNHTHNFPATTNQYGYNTVCMIKIEELMKSPITLGSNYFGNHNHKVPYTTYTGEINPIPLNIEPEYVQLFYIIKKV